MTSVSSMESYDVIVVGGGNTALVTALRAHEAGAKVLVLEKAPKVFRGGNGYFTTGIYRVVQNGIEDCKDLMPDLTEEERNLDITPYTPDEFFSDYMRITGGMVDPELMEMIIGQSTEAIRWMVKKQGIKMELNTLSLRRIDDRLSFYGKMPVQAKGGGAGLSDALYGKLEEKGIELLYETAATKLLLESNGRVSGVTASGKDTRRDIKSKAVILSCGGFESNPEWRARYLGKNWDLVKVRGTRYNMGDGLRMAMEIGAQPTGNWSGCHAIFIEADAPQPAVREDTEKTSKRGYAYGLVVNVDGKRFVDEGEDETPFTYARYGQYVLEQPQRVAFQIFDSKTHPFVRTIAEYATAAYVEGNTLEELAEKLGVNALSLATMVKEYNESIKPGGTVTIPDRINMENKHSEGISPSKSNWAYPLDMPPFYAYPIVCGITFSLGGLKVNQRAQVLNTVDQPIPGLYAAGEIIGGLFYNNYPGACGQMTGVVFARIAGANAATD